MFAFSPSIMEWNQVFVTPSGYFALTIIQEYENGDFEFSFSAPKHETFWYGVILSFGNKARIIEPQEIKERILKTCKELQTEYGGIKQYENERNQTI